MGHPTAVRPAADNIAMNTLPAEIVTKILTDVLSKKRMDRATRKTFQVLRSVCPQWREICLSTPEFWSALSVTTRKIGQEAVEAWGYGHLIEKWLDRSGSSVRLELELFEDEFETPMSEKDREAVVCLVVEHQSRWRYLSLHIDPSELRKIFAKAPVDDWRLETFCIFHYYLLDQLGLAMAMVEDGKRNPLNQITTLKKLVVSDTDIHSTHETANLARLSIVKLDLSIDRVKLCHFRLLEICIHLVTLSIKMKPNPSTRWPDEILSSIICPALAEFHLITLVSPPRRNSYSTPTTLLKPPVLADSFLSHATDCLSRIEIEGGPISDTVLSQLLECLSWCPSKNLTVVGVDRWPCTDEPVPVDWCPNACELRIGGQVGWISLGDAEGIVRTEQLVEYLNKRLEWEGNKLKRLVVRKDPFLISFPYGDLKALEAKGLKVTVIPTSLAHYVHREW
ncbi:hypothetical protein BKA70DRAFT_1539088 [Coprinopsis sp. MPI-PUGE-AT-0042]|nr:hypothetical protein BKA70DRAFT_1539088 [Coprinopsis sp. MPI-PUGE-AT-0042]